MLSAAQRNTCGPGFGEPEHHSLCDVAHLAFRGTAAVSPAGPGPGADLDHPCGLSDPAPVAKFDFPVVPDLDKDTLPALTALALSVFMLKDRVGLLPDGRIGRVLILFFFLSPFFTVLTNGDPIPARNGMILPGMRIYDSVAAVANHVIYALPLFLGRRYLATPQAARALLAALVAGALPTRCPC